MADASHSSWMEWPDRREFADANIEPLSVGLVNNMPDGALQSTERQFADLLQASGRPFRLTVYSLPGLPRSEAGRRHVEAVHRPFSQLMSDRLDGMIVTGAVPRAANFEDETYWPSFSQLVDWADEHTVSTVWSCLAAHAAVYRLDGISRVLQNRKLSGIFECARRLPHPLLQGCPSSWRVPHSRHYGIDEGALSAARYQILAGSEVVGADIFSKRRTALHVFLQGHPEYDAGTLGLEYRRDVSRYLSGQSDRYPECPLNYLEPRSEAMLRAFRDRAVRCRDAALIDDIPKIEPCCGEPITWWKPVAKLIYRNWLTGLAEIKHTRFDWRRRAETPESTNHYEPRINHYLT